MRLVDRDTFETVRVISETEKRSLVDLYNKSNSSYAGSAIDIIKEARSEHHYFVCDCVPDQPASPTLSTRHVSQGNYTLVNLPGRHPHAFNCPFVYTPTGASEKTKGHHHEIKQLVYMDDGRFQVNEEQLETLYRSLTTNTQLNRLHANLDLDPQAFRAKLLDGCRLSPELAKQGISKKLRFGMDQYAPIAKGLQKGDSTDWVVLISLIDGSDGHNLLKGDVLSKPYRIPAGKIISRPAVTFGPMVATTVIASKGHHVFSLATAIDSVYTPEIPLVVSCHEDRLILNDLVGERSLLEWIDQKQAGSDEVSFVDVHCLPTVAPITKSRTRPRMTIGKNGVRLLVADPTKKTREAYDEQGVVLWHRSFSHIPSRFADDLKQFKSKIAAMLLSKHQV